MKKPEFLAKTFIPTALTIFQSQVLAYRMIVFTALKYGSLIAILDTYFLLGRKDVNSNFQLKRLLNLFF